MPKTKPKYLAAIKNTYVKSLLMDGGALDQVMIGDPKREAPPILNDLSIINGQLDEITPSANATMIARALRDLVMMDRLYVQKGEELVKPDFNITNPVIDDLGKKVFVEIQFNHILAQEKKFNHSALVDLFTHHETDIKQALAKKEKAADIENMMVDLKKSSNENWLKSNLRSKLEINIPDTESVSNIFNELAADRKPTNIATSTAAPTVTLTAAPENKPQETQAIHQQEQPFINDSDDEYGSPESSLEEEEDIPALKAAEKTAPATHKPITGPEAAEKIHIHPEDAILPQPSHTTKKKYDEKEIAAALKELNDFMNKNTFQDIITKTRGSDLQHRMIAIHDENRILTGLIEAYEQDGNSRNKENYNHLKKAVNYFQKTAEQYTKDSGSHLFSSDKRDIANIEKKSEQIMERAEREMGWQAKRGERPSVHIQNCENQIDLINIIIGQLLQKKTHDDKEIEDLIKQRDLLNHTIENVIKRAQSRKEVRLYTEQVDRGTLPPDEDPVSFILRQLRLNSSSASGGDNHPGTSSAMLQAISDPDDKPVGIAQFTKQIDLGPSEYWVHKDTYTHIDDAKKETAFEVKSAACTVNGKYTSFLNYGNALPVLSDEQVYTMAAKFMLEAHGDAPGVRFKITGDPRFVKAVHLFCECSNDNIPKPNTSHHIEITDNDRKQMNKFLEKPDTKKAITGSENAILSKREEEKIKNKEETPVDHPGPRNPGAHT